MALKAALMALYLVACGPKTPPQDAAATAEKPAPELNTIEQEIAACSQEIGNVDVDYYMIRRSEGDMYNVVRFQLGDTHYAVLGNEAGVQMYRSDKEIPREFFSAGYDGEHAVEQLSTGYVLASHPNACTIADLQTIYITTVMGPTKNVDQLMDELAPVSQPMDALEGLLGE